MSAVRIPIPPGHAAHWRVADDGSIKVEIMRFYTRHKAQARAHSERKVAA